MQDIYLSPHFELREFTDSATARKYGIANKPPAEAVENLKALCVHTLEPLREVLRLPIIITSGFRCKALNDRVSNHSSRSQHMKGCAADFVVQGASRRELLIKAFRTIITNPAVDYDQLIVYPSFIHVSYVSREFNRHKLTKGFGNGKYCALSREEAMELI